MSSPLITDGAWRRATRPRNVTRRERWSARGDDVARQLDSWSEILAATHLAFEVSATHRTPAPFVGGVVRRAIGDLMLVDCAAVPFQGRRDAAMIGAHGPSSKEDVLGFQFVHKGVETVRDGSREITLTPGQVVLWDGLQTDRHRDRAAVLQAHAAVPA